MMRCMQCFGPTHAADATAAQHLSLRPKIAAPSKDYLSRRQCTATWLLTKESLQPSLVEEESKAASFSTPPSPGLHRLTQGQSSNISMTDNVSESSPALSQRRRQSMSVETCVPQIDEKLPELVAQRSLVEDELPSTFEIEVPENCAPGDQLVAIVGNDKLKLTVPRGAAAGDLLTFVHQSRGKAATRRFSSSFVSTDHTLEEIRHSLKARRSMEPDELFMMEVDVPEGCVTGDVLNVQTPSGLCKVVVPENAAVGTTLAFYPPKSKSKSITKAG